MVVWKAARVQHRAFLLAGDGRTAPHQYRVPLRSVDDLRPHRATEHAEVVVRTDQRAHQVIGRVLEESSWLIDAILEWRVVALQARRPAIVGASKRRVVVDDHAEREVRLPVAEFHDATLGGE